MTSEEFCNYLKGYLKISKKKEINEEELKVIIEMLDNVQVSMDWKADFYKTVDTSTPWWVDDILSPVCSPLTTYPYTVTGSIK